MIWMYLKEDIISYNRKTIYGKKGERVIIISNHHPAICVTSETGNSFPCSMEHLSTTKIQKDDKINNKHKG